MQDHFMTTKEDRHQFMMKQHDQLLAAHIKEQNQSLVAHIMAVVLYQLPHL